MNKVCVVTGNRADFGPLHWLITDLQRSEAFELQIIVTGGHFAQQQGYSWRAVEQAGFNIDHKIDIPQQDDSGVGAGIQMGGILSEMSTALGLLQPALIVLLGDRFEILAAASAAVLQSIPIAHLHGGELTCGAFDDSIRHALTKMSSFHFTAAEEYRRRVIQLGEKPNHVFNVGAFGIDAITRTTLFNEQEIRTQLAIPEKIRYVIITWHPETLELDTTQNFDVLLKTLEYYQEIFLVFTRPNNDPQGQTINAAIDAFVALHLNHANVHDSLGMKRYLSALKYADCMIGNSSSGIIEAPTMSVPTLNIGDRQKGRLRASSVIDCSPQHAEIKLSLDFILQQGKEKYKKIKTPYGNGNASKETVAKLIQLFKSQQIVSRKEFYDINNKTKTAL